MTAFLIQERDERGIVTLTMNRPEQRNALSEEHEMLEFVQTCEALERDDGVRAVILTGAGPAFSAGGNVKHMRDKKSFSAGSPVQVCEAYRRGIQRIPLALYHLNVPTIAAINGPAIGAGLDLACMCDIRVAAPQASFAASFIRLGIVPADGGAWLLSRLVGSAKALELMLTGERFDTEAALRMGLVTAVTGEEELLSHARSLAERIAAQPPLTLRLTKRLLRESQYASLSSSLELAAAYQALAHHTRDHDEAVNAFLEKRPAVYRGC